MSSLLLWFYNHVFLRIPRICMLVISLSIPFSLFVFLTILFSISLFPYYFLSSLSVVLCMWFSLSTKFSSSESYESSPLLCVLYCSYHLQAFLLCRLSKDPFLVCLSIFPCLISDNSVLRVRSTFSMPILSSSWEWFTCNAVTSSWCNTFSQLWIW